MNRELTLALPLVKSGHTKYLLIEYNGTKREQFYYLCKHILENDYSYLYYAYNGKNEQKIQIFIDVLRLDLETAESILKKISKKLQLKISKEWKCLPLSSLPEEYNIATLPYGQFKL